jgi:hypothetical protein
MLLDGFWDFMHFFCTENGKLGTSELLMEVERWDMGTAVFYSYKHRIMGYLAYQWGSVE